jgi:hypothetical protein
MILATIAALALQTADPIVGVWRGTSICQVRPSACNDEQAVYHVTRQARGGYAFEMNKIVAGVEVTMGVLDTSFVPGTTTLTGFTYDRAHRRGTWTFTPHGSHMSGRLTGQDGLVLRVIELDRAP